MPAGFAFHRKAHDGDARCGELATPHGTLQTPAFMPVATLGAVRGVSAAELEALGAQGLLANAYHLEERPGAEVVAAAGGLRGFTGWRGPWLTDSGGYQVTSLADRVVVTEAGVDFASPLDGRRRLLTPERAIEIQEALGADLISVLDECRPIRSHGPASEPAGRDGDAIAVRVAMERTLRWADRARRARRRDDQLLFGIVQGGASAALRAESARRTAELGFDAYAHGGLGLGEDATRREELIARVHEQLPAGAPRYLMGLGRPEDLVNAIARGVDLFDCVVPTRHARHGVLFTRSGRLFLRNARHRADAAPPDPDCDCPTCTRHSRAYLRHLFHAGEVLGPRLASLHNLRFYFRLLAEAREAIAERRFDALRARVLESAAARAD